MGEAAAAVEDIHTGVVVPAPRPSKGVASWALDLLERLAVRLGHDKAKPLHWLSGNFAPVRDETPPAAGLPVQGHLPECLNGEFVRVGPNPKFVPVAGYHWFDGDGMNHAMRIKDGKATYVSRYVKTSRLKQGVFWWSKVYEANAWEEGDEVILITCRLENPDLDKMNGHQSETFGNELYEMRFNMKTGAASQKQLSVSAVDFPRINESYTGRKQRFVYCTILDSIWKVTGVIKFDLHVEPESGKKQLEVGGNMCGIYDLGPGRFGSEAVFVPKVPGVSGEEDDGYLILFVHNENTGKSEVNVIDAKTMSADPVAVVELPNRVPYGLHAFFVNEEQLVLQAEG